MTRLRVIAGPHHGAQFELRDLQIVIGRDLDCDIRFPDSLVSRHHAKLILQGDAYLLHDLGSTNGSFVNSEKVSETRLADGDTIRLADVELAVEIQDDETPANAPATGSDSENKAATGPIPAETTSPAPALPARKPGFLAKHLKRTSGDLPTLDRPPLSKPKDTTGPAATPRPAGEQNLKIGPPQDRGVWRPPTVPRHMPSPKPTQPSSPPSQPKPELKAEPKAETKPEPKPALKTEKPPTPKAASVEKPPSPKQPMPPAPAQESAPPRTGLLGRLFKRKPTVADTPLPPPKPRPPAAAEPAPVSAPQPKPTPKPVPQPAPKPVEIAKREKTAAVEIPLAKPKPAAEKPAGGAIPIRQPTTATPKPEPKPEAPAKPSATPPGPKPSALAKPTATKPATPPAAKPTPQPAVAPTRPAPRPTVAGQQQRPNPAAPVPTAKKPQPKPGEAKAQPRPQPIRQVAAPANVTAEGADEIYEEPPPLFKRTPFAIGCVVGILLLIAGYYGESNALIFWGLLLVVVGSLGTICNWSPLPPKQRG